MENGRAPRQKGKKDTAGNWTLRLSKMQEILQSSIEQEEDSSLDIGHSHTRANIESTSLSVMMRKSISEDMFP